MSDRPRLVATDLDGTLLRTDGSVSARTREVLAALDDAGVPVVMVTGRPRRWLEELRPLVGGHGLAIVSNGAAVYDVARDAVRDLRGIEREAGLALVERIRRAVPGATFAVESAAGIVRDPDFVEPHRVPDGSPVGPLHEVWEGPALKVLVRHPGLEAADLRRAVIEAVAGRATPTWSVEGLVEISAVGVTKAAALQRLAEELGVVPADVVAFGDMPNDVPMLQWAGSSYAVANAHPEALAAADATAPANDDDGVASVLAGLFGL